MFYLISLILATIVLIFAPTIIICSLIKFIKPKWGGDPLFFYNISVKIALDYYFYHNFSHKVIVTKNDNTYFFDIKHFEYVPKKFSIFFEIINLLDHSYKYIADKIINFVIYIYKVSLNIYNKVTVNRYNFYIAFAFAIVFYLTLIFYVSSSVGTDIIDYLFVYLYNLYILTYESLRYIVLLGIFVFSKFFLVLLNGMEYPLNLDPIDINTNNILESSNNSQDNNQLVRGSRPNSSQSNNPSVTRGSGSNSPESNSQIVVRGSRSNSQNSNSQLVRGSRSNSQDIQRISIDNSSQDNNEGIIRRPRSLNTNNQSVIPNDRSRSPIDRIPNYRSRSPINQSIASNNIQGSSNEVLMSSQTTVNSLELTNTQSLIQRSNVVWQQRITNMMLSKGYVLTGHEFNSGGILIIFRDLLSYVEQGEILILPDFSNISMNGKEIVHEFIHELLIRNLSNNANLALYNRGMPLNPEYYSFEHPDIEEGLEDIDPLWMYTDEDDLFLGFTPNYWVLTINSPEFSQLNVWQQTYKLLAQPIIYQIELYETNFNGVNLNFETEEEEFYFHKHNIKSMESKLSLVRYYLYLYPDVDRRGALLSELIREIDELKEWFEDAFSDRINSNT